MTTFAEGRERNLALGIYGAASGSGAAAGVLLGGVLTSYLSWSWIFFINVPVGVAAIALTPFLLRESRAELPHRHFDFAGAASITSGLMLLVYAMTRAASDGWGSDTTLALLSGSAALVARVRPDRAALALAAAAAADVPTEDAHGRERSDGDRGVGGVLRVLPLDAVPAGRPPLLGGPERRRIRRLRASRRRGFERRTGDRGAGRRATDAHGRVARVRRVSVAWLTRLPVDGHYFWDLFPAFVLGGAGMGFSFVPVTIAGLAGVERADAGVASGLINTSRQIGGAIGLAAVSAIAAASTTHYADSHPAVSAASGVALDHGLQTALYILTGLLVAGALVVVALVRPTGGPSAQLEPVDRDALALEEAA